MKYMGAKVWLSPQEVADVLGFNVKTIQRFCRERLLPSIKFGKRRWLIDAEKFERFLSAGKKL